MCKPRRRQRNESDRKRDEARRGVLERDAGENERDRHVGDRHDNAHLDCDRTRLAEAATGSHEYCNGYTGEESPDEGNLVGRCPIFESHPADHGTGAPPERGKESSGPNTFLHGQKRRARPNG